MPIADTGLPAVPAYLVDQAERMLERADGKAFGLAAGAMATLALSAPRLPHGGPTWLLVSGLSTWGAGIVALMLAVYPRLRRSGPGLFFGDLAASFDLGVARRRTQTLAADPERWLLEQAHTLSRIAVVKYRLIRAGMALFGAGVALVAIALL